MKVKVKLLGKTVDVELSKSAAKNLEKRDHHLCLEMELYFSCMIRKQVNVRPAIDSGISVFVNDKLEIGFRPVMTKACSVSACDGDAPPVSDFPVARPEKYIPEWLRIDFRKGRWTGEFGYCRNAEPVAV